MTREIQRPTLSHGIEAENQAIPTLPQEMGPTLDRVSRPRSSQRWRWIGIGGVLLTLGLGGVGLSGWLRSEPVEEQTTSPAITLLPVSMMVAEAVDSYQVERFHTGEIQARRASELGFERSGELILVGVEEGDAVLAGQVLAQLDTRTLAARRQQVIAQRDQVAARLQELQEGPRPEQIEAARAAVVDLEEQLALSQLQQERREDLYRQGAISREQLDEVAFAGEALAARLRGAESQLQELETGTRVEQLTAQQAQVEQLQAQVAEIDVELSKSQLIAPFAGRIGARRRDEGTVVGAGQSVLRLVEDGELEAWIGVPISAQAAVPVGSQHPITANGTTYEAVVTGILPEVDDPTRTVTVILRMAPGSAVTVGQTVRLRLQETVPGAEGFWVPTTALAPSVRGLWSVYTLRSVDAVDQPPRPDPDVEVFQVARQEVEIIHIEGDQALVRGTLQSGDAIVKDGVQRIVSGQWVTVDP